MIHRYSLVSFFNTSIQNWNPEIRQSSVTHLSEVITCFWWYASGKPRMQMTHTLQFYCPCCRSRNSSRHKCEHILCYHYHWLLIKMTVSYALTVSSVSYCAFLKLLRKWKGSVLKAVWSELVVWLALYAVIAVVVNLAFDLETKRWEAKRRTGISECSEKIKDFWNGISK